MDDIVEDVNYSAQGNPVPDPSPTPEPSPSPEPSPTPSPETPSNPHKNTKKSTKAKDALPDTGDLGLASTVAVVACSGILLEGLGVVLRFRRRG